MKKILTLALVVLMLLSTVACGKTNNGTGSQSGSNGENQQSGNGSGNGGDTQNAGNAGGAKLSGKLALISLSDRDPSILRGIRIIGNVAGTSQDINGKKSSLTDVRCIFELNEWVAFYPDTGRNYALRVWVLKHRDDWAYYNTCQFSDLMPNFVAYCDLHYPADEEKPDESQWGSFYLNKDDCNPGYYDFVFTYEGKAIAVLQTRFYAENELTVKSGAQLEALMHE